MRTTVDLPPAVHRRAKELAQARGTSLSEMVAELTVRGLGQMDEPVKVSTDPMTGLPVISIGRRVTQQDVEDFLGEE